MTFRKSPQRRFELDALEPRRMLSAAPATHLNIQETQTTDIGFSAFIETAKNNAQGVPELYTDVHFASGEDWVKTASGVTTGTQTALNLDIYDVIQGIAWISTAGFDPTQPFTTSFTFDPTLHTLHSVGSGAQDDDVSGQDLPATYNITCTNTGLKDVYSSLTVDNSTPGVTVITLVQGAAWNAHVTGVVTCGGSVFYTPVGNQIADPTYQSAEIDYSTTTVWTITPSLPIKSGTWSNTYSLPAAAAAAIPLASKPSPSLFSNSPITASVAQQLLGTV
jgi:hypothetical protein